MRVCASAAAVVGLPPSSSIVRSTGWPLIPPVALVQATQAFRVSSMPPYDDESGPLNEPIVPTTIGVPVAVELDEPLPEAGDDPVAGVALGPQLHAPNDSVPIPAAAMPSLILDRDCTVPPSSLLTWMPKVHFRDFLPCT